ncbi:hypothetical protein EBR43_10835 [bacterium]|nr:hypothetical protein [bacterium]
MWFEYRPPTRSAIDEMSRRLDNTELFPGAHSRTNKLLSRLKACSLASSCPETVDLIFDILDKYYVGSTFYPSQLEDLKQIRYDVFLAVDKYIKLGKIKLYEYKPLDVVKKINIPRRRVGR